MVTLNDLRPLLTKSITAAFVFSIATSDAMGAPLRSPFAGRWRMDTTSLKGNIKPTTIALAKGFFSKDGSSPIKADGKFHRVSGSGYIDETSISIINDHVVREVDRVRGSLAYAVDYKASHDGQTLTLQIGNYTSPNGKAVEGVTVQHRVGAVRPGSHLVSGKWARVSVTVDSKSDWIMRLNGNRFSWRTEYGTGYDAVIGGGPVRIDGDSAGVRALITRPRHDTIIETDLSKSGKRVAALTMRMLPNGNRIFGTAWAGETKETTKFYLNRVAYKSD